MSSQFFKRKPSLVEAIQLTKDNVIDVIEFVTGKECPPEERANILDRTKCCDNPDHLHGVALGRNGEVIEIDVGDWVCRGLKGGVYTVSEAEFKICYEPPSSEDELSDLMKTSIRLARIHASQLRPHSLMEILDKAYSKAKEAAEDEPPSAN